MYIHSLQFDCEPLDGLTAEKEEFRNNQIKEVKKFEKKFLISCIFSIPAFIISMILIYINSIHNFLENTKVISGYPNITWMGIILFILCTPVQFYIGYDFYISAYRALKRKTSNMSTLIAVGTTTAYIYAFIGFLFAFIFPNYNSLSNSIHYFETSSTVITTILLGKYLQFKAKFKTTDAITLLMDLQSSMATIVKLDKYGSILNEYDISTELVEKGDIVKILRGSRVPLDGKIIYGISSIDESMLTGESIPKIVKIGDNILASSINCGDNVLFIKVNKIKEESTLSKIIELMKNSQLNKPSQQEFADTVSSYFVPIVISIAIITFIIWYVLYLVGIVPHSWLDGQNAVIFALTFAS